MVTSSRTSSTPFQDLIDGLVLEYKQLQKAFESISRENASLRDTLQAHGFPQIPSPSDTRLSCASNGTTHKPAVTTDVDCEFSSSRSPNKLIGSWDITDSPNFCISTETRCRPHSGNVSGQGGIESDISPRPTGTSKRSKESKQFTRDVPSFFDQPPDLLPMWDDTVADVEPSPSGHIRFAGPNRQATMICGEAVVDEHSFCQTLIVRPNSIPRALWDSLSVIMLVYDIIYIPLEVFEFQRTSLMAGMEWSTTCFWTADILASFLTGYHTEGIVEMRPAMISRRYVKSGLFVLDLIVVLVDWILTIVTSGVKAVVRLGKTARAFRLLRIFRTLRLLRGFKLQRLLTELFHWIKSDLLRTLASIFLMLVVLVVFNHYFACGWYAIGVLTASETSWLTQNGVDPDDARYTYVTALHWSLTQFTPAGMEVHPHNVVERIYTICVLLFALVTFSSFVSGITSGMMFLRKLKTEPAQQEAILRQYFQESRISAELGQRIWKFLQNNHFQYRKRLHRKDLPILNLVPDSLKDKLSEELYLPVVNACPFFDYFGILDNRALCEVTHRALGEISLTTREDLFVEGKQAEKMYFITSGELSYRHRERSLCERATEGQWACEPVLWMNWVHCGRMSARTSCEIIQLSAVTFQDIISRCHFGLQYVRIYARSFQEYLSKSDPWYTDLWTDLPQLQELVHRAKEETRQDDARCDTLSQGPTSELAGPQTESKSWFPWRSWSKGSVPDSSLRRCSDGSAGSL
mmetsp:Transcript_44989/g.101227  ORF Transcript_44989/g.101227 Transcript_44989/m.101227 type:complete len:749 (-) Transcript_44989:95-2341(-)